MLVASPESLNNCQTAPGGTRWEAGWSVSPGQIQIQLRPIHGLRLCSLVSEAQGPSCCLRAAS